MSRFLHVVGLRSATDATGKTGGYRIATSAANVSQALPSGWKADRATLGPNGTGPKLRIATKGGAIQYSFSAGAQTLVIDKAAALSGANSDPEVGSDLGAGQVEYVHVPIGATHFNVIGAAGFVSLSLCEGGWQ